MSAIEELARRCGIEESFRDAAGEIRETAAETRKLLLASMGFPVEGERDAESHLETMERAEWERSLPPVRVAYAEHGAITVEVTVPAGTREFRWRILLEDGGERSGIAECGGGRRDGAGQAERCRITLDGEIPYGYHQLHSELDGATCSLIVTPGSCWLPPAAGRGERLWGVAAQLYLLRSSRNWGIGDFTDLGELVRLVDAHGGDVVGLNPLHAMFLDKPEQASPYSPEDRLLLNVLNIDIGAVPELECSPETRQLIATEEFQRQLAACRAAPLVEYHTVAALKLQALKLLFECSRHATQFGRWKEFEAFRKRAGQGFERGCLFAALRQHFWAINPTLADWHSWPAEYRDAGSAAVARFAEEHSGDVTMLAWMQWVADEQLGKAAAAAKDMEIGLYRDLAVGTDPSGAAIWSNPDAVVSGAHVGAPPDMYNAAGQDWGLPPFHPRTLFENGYRIFIELVRANMRHAGGLRIDHVMALQHLYWVPAGKAPTEGAYVRYPLDDLIGVLALESHRSRCLVVGEDLGTVPNGFRERMAKANILSYRVLFFEQDSDSGAYLAPDGYPRLSIAVTGSHDLPTVRAWWTGSDIDLKEQLKLFQTGEGPEEARQRRERDRRELIQALEREQLLTPGETVRTEDVTTAVHAYLARSESLIAMTQLDDLTAETEPVNVPATSDEHPNWRRRQSLSIEQLAAHPRFERLARTYRRERP